MDPNEFNQIGKRGNGIVYSNRVAHMCVIVGRDWQPLAIAYVSLVHTMHIISGLFSRR